MFWKRKLEAGRGEACRADAACEGRLDGFGSKSGERGALGVLGHTQVVKDQTHVTVELAHFLRDALDGLSFDQRDREAA